MLAIKECLRREGVLNLAGTATTQNNNNHNCNNNNNNNNQNNNNNNMIKDKSSGNYIFDASQRFDSKMDKLGHQKSTALQNSDIQNNSASCNRIARPLATATTSCQQQQQRPEHQAKSTHQQTIHATGILNAPTTTAPSAEQTPTEVTESVAGSVLESATKTPKRYQGLHPHFHHHTAPAYYTDVHLRIHTPRASDVAALNENYRSVYATPSQLLDERSRFPKTISTTLVPPPPTASALSTVVAPVDSDRETRISATSNPAAASTTAQQSRTAFFRGGSAGCEAPSGLEPSVKLSPTFPNRTKGKLSPYLPAATSQRATRSCRQSTHPAHQTAANSVDGVADTSYRTQRRPGSSSSSGRSRNPTRFAGRKRAVRVRSESRPISALYDIICKEKGFDVCTTTTNDEDSSASNSTDGDDGDERQRQRQRQRERDRDRDRSHELCRQRHNAARHRLASSSPAEEAEEVCCPCRRHADSAMSSRMESPGAETFKGGYHEQTHAHANRSMHIHRAHSEAGAVVPKKKCEHRPALAGANMCSDEECIELKSSPKKTNLHEMVVQPSDQPEFDLSTACLVASDKYLQSSRIPVQCQAETDAHTQSQPFHHHHHHEHQNQSPSSCVCTPPPSEYSELASFDNRVVYPTAKLYVEPVCMDLSGFHGCSVGANSAGGVVGGGSVGGATTTTGAGTTVAGSAARTARQGSKMNRANVNATSGIQATTATDIAGDNYADGVLSAGDLSAEDTDEADEQTKRKTKNKARRYITRPHRVPSLCSLHAVAPKNSDNSINSDCANDNAGADVECCAAYQGPDKVPATTTAPLASTSSTTSSTNTTNNSSALDTVNIDTASASPAPLTTRLVMTNSASKSGAVAAVVDAGRADSADDGAAPVNRSSPNDSVSTAANVIGIADKRKDDEQQQQHNSASSPTSPRHQLSRICGGGGGFGTATSSKTRQRFSSSGNQQVVVTADAESSSVAAATTPPTPQSPPVRKLVPSVSVLMKQNLCELHYNGVSNTNTSPSAATKTATKAKETQTRPQKTAVECTVKVGACTPKSTLVDAASQFDGERSFNEVDVGLRVLRPRCSTMVSNETVGLSSATKASLSSAAQARSASSVAAPDLSPVAKLKTPETSPIHNEGRDKSSKRKSNLNRSQNDEATHECDESSVVRRRRRRELGLSRQLIPSEDAVLRELISPRKSAGPPSAAGVASSSSNGAIRVAPARTDLAFHMENARRGLDLIRPHVPTVDRRRAQTTSPKIEVARLKAASAARVSRRSDTLPLTELRKLRSNDVNRKLNDRTKSDLAEIMKIAEMANNASEQSATNFSSCAQEGANTSESKPLSASSSATAIAIENLSSSINRIHVSHEREIAPADRPIEKEKSSKILTLSGVEQGRPATGKHATFVRDSCVYYEPEVSEDQFAEDVLASGSSNSLRQYMLKARSVERDDGYEPLKLSPILRRKSTDDLAGSSLAAAAPPAATHSHIVSILKKKDYLAGESSSASSNASPVTFSANVVDTPTKQKRAGILKKRSSLDESRYYSRSHSPDERSILIKSARRNSLEETAAVAHLAAIQQHGILKQSSYDSSKSDGCPSATETAHPHGILKKKDSTSTPSDGGSHVPKHVSISQAVILAAAELSHETVLDGADYDEVYTPGNEEYEIRPILKLETTSSEEAVRPPKPILKKKSSGDSDEHEIRPILKTSRKSSREEFDTAGTVGASGDEMRYLSETGMRPILKTELPSKHRSLGTETNEGGKSTTWPSLLTRRTRSLERHDHPSPAPDLAAAMNAITTSQVVPPLCVDAEAIPPPKLSVAERIRNMELFLSTQHSTPTNDAANTTFESALQSSVGSNLMTPSAIKRDLYRDRYKTQPVTSDEKSFFRATYSPFDKSTPSAFHPAKPLHHQQAEPQREPRTSTQPLHVAASSNKVLIGGGKIKTDPTNSHDTDDDDSHISINDATFDRVAFSDSERIFEMSGIDTSANGSGANNSGTPSGTGSGASVSRSNSVRARANMFQQLQQQKASATSTPIERTSPGRVTHRPSSPPTVQSPITPAAVIQSATKRSQPHLSDEEIETAETRTGAGAGALEPPLAIRGILKSKSGGVGFMPVNLNSELKNRLKCSTHASVGNLRKSESSAVGASGAGVDDSQLPLGKSSSEQNDPTTAIKQPHTHDDAVSLVRNLSSLGTAPQSSKSGGDAGSACASTSEGESSGGREISEIIKNSAVARRRKQNDGSLIAKSKSHTSVPVSGGISIGIGPQLPPFGGSVGFVKLRHVGGVTTVDRVQTPSSSTTTIIVANEDQRDVATAPSEASESTHVASEAAGKNNRSEGTVELREKPTALPTFLQGGQLRRCQTQVMGPDQRIITITKTGSIADRLAALQKSGEDDWKRRISKRDEVDEIKHENFVNESLSLAHSLSDKPISQSPLIPTNLEGGKVSDRLGQLKSSSESWRNRVGQSDASKFTVAGRLQKNAQSSIELQFARSANDVAKKCPMAVVRCAHQPQFGLAKSPSMMVTSALHDGRANNSHHSTLLQRCLSTTSGDEVEKAIACVGESSDSNSDSDTDGRSNEKENKNQANTKSVTAAAEAAAAAAIEATAGGARVIVPRQEDDETFERFFSSKQPLRLTNIDENVHIADFDNIKATPRLVTKRTVQGPKGRRAARNPLKSLAARTDIASEYTEVKTGIAEREMRRIQLESYGQRGNLAAEAIAGLASVEDFKAVALRSSSLPLNQLWVPYKPVMLLHVKGRMHVQTRLVEPTYKSLNRGDCFLLVVGSQLFRYVGSFANVIEISRSKKICAHIIENKDLGCTAAIEVVLNDGKLSNERNWKAFWALLGKPDDYEIPDSGHADEDDLFELSLIETNKIYEFVDDSLMPLEKYWGCIPKVEMLDSRKVLVFDFGSELYVWNGKNAPTDAKRAAIKLAEEHFNAGPTDYSECYVNPLNYAEVVGHRESYMFLKSCERRGDWCVLGKITQNMETALFKEKFSDWPELEREDLEKDYLANGVNSVKALNGDALFKGELYEEPNQVLENANLGRGHFYYDTDTMRHFDIVTKSTSKWRINEFNFDNAEASSYGHFYSAESYIVRWIYQISVTVRELSGKISNRSTVGRERCVYFCWQGGDASANEKGAAALLTVELDKEKGAQVRIAQGDESTAFVRLCQPLMVQHRGRKSDCLQRRALWRLYHIMGNMPEETIVKEVDCHQRQLRSRASLLLVHGEHGLIFIWHGCQSAEHTRKVATKAADALMQQRADDIFTTSADTIACEAVEEGSEPSAFREALDDLDITAYCSLLGCATKDFGYTLRAYHFSSTQGVFSAAELQYALRCKELHSPYPFTQTQLYNARQPTIFMLDDGDELWLWMGWWPLEDVDINAEERSSPTMENRAGVNRWISERRAAVETAVAYWRSKFGDNKEEFHGIRGNVVWAGLEPLAFQALFPDWLEREDVRDINVQDGRTNAATPIVSVLAQLTQTEYPLTVLKKRPLPEGVDPTRLELYLNAEDFQLALGVSRADFEQMPLWKQTNLKKMHELF